MDTKRNDVQVGECVFVVERDSARAIRGTLLHRDEEWGYIERLGGGSYVFAWSEVDVQRGRP